VVDLVCRLIERWPRFASQVVFGNVKFAPELPLDSKVKLMNALARYPEAHDWLQDWFMEILANFPQLNRPTQILALNGLKLSPLEELMYCPEFAGLFHAMTTHRDLFLAAVGLLEEVAFQMDDCLDLIAAIGIGDLFEFAVQSELFEAVRTICIVCANVALGGVDSVSFLCDLGFLPGLVGLHEEVDYRTWREIILLIAALVTEGTEGHIDFLWQFDVLYLLGEHWCTMTGEKTSEFVQNALSCIGAFCVSRPDLAFSEEAIEKLAEIAEAEDEVSESVCSLLRLLHDSGNS
jgi:hypothetical protein